MHAFAQAAEVDYHALASLAITAPLTQTGFPSCSIVALTPERTSDGRPLVGRNYDMLYEFPCTLYRTYPEQGYAHMGGCDIWFGREDGQNEAGLFVGITATMLSGYQPGLTFWFVVRMILERCATVAEGLELLQCVPHAQSRNFLLADRHGDVAAVEVTIDDVHVRRPQNGLLVVTNHVVSKELVNREAFVPPDSPIRYQRLKELLGGDWPAGPEQAKDALRDHDGLLCAHWTHMEGGTLWSWIIRPGQRQMELAEGHPCDTPYQTVSF